MPETAYMANTTDLTAVANAIRTKGGTSEQLSFPNGFVSAIDGLGGGDNVFIVEMIDDEYGYEVLTATCKEIFDAAKDGNAVMAYISSSSDTMIMQFPLVQCVKAGNTYRFYFLGVDVNPFSTYGIEYQNTGDNSIPHRIYE